jgi:hypothetical protein
MADDKRSTSNERRRRPAPTIDLSATEVKPAEPPPQDDSKDDNTGETVQATEPSRRVRSIAVAVVVGIAVGAAGVTGALWLTGALQTTRQTTDTLAPRVAALEAQVKSAQKPSDNPAVAELTSRMSKLEQAVAKLPAASADASSAERLGTIENALKALGVTLAALNRRAEDTAANVSAARERADAAAKAAESLQARVEAIERSAKATQDKVAQNSGADTVARRALAAVALRDAVASGAAYSAELAIAKELGADAKAVAALEPFARSGVPSEADLARELSALLPRIESATGADASQANGFFERLQANASKLVRVQPIGEPAGDEPSAVIARIEVKAARHDLSGVEQEMNKLPAKARDFAASWMKRFAARNDAVAAARKLAADSAAALGAR